MNDNVAGLLASLRGGRERGLLATLKAEVARLTNLLVQIDKHRVQQADLIGGYEKKLAEAKRVLDELDEHRSRISDAEQQAKGLIEMYHDPDTSEPHKICTEEPHWPAKDVAPETRPAPAEVTLLDEDMKIIKRAVAPTTDVIADWNVLEAYVEVYGELAVRLALGQSEADWRAFWDRGSRSHPKRKRESLTPGLIRDARNQCVDNDGKLIPKVIHDFVTAGFPQMSIAVACGVSRSAVNGALHRYSRAGFEAIKPKTDAEPSTEPSAAEPSDEAAVVEPDDADTLFDEGLCPICQKQLVGRPKMCFAHGAHDPKIALVRAVVDGAPGRNWTVADVARKAIADSQWVGSRKGGHAKRQVEAALNRLSEAGAILAQSDRGGRISTKIGRGRTWKSLRDIGVGALNRTR
jgi:hypothetical protein